MLQSLDQHLVWINRWFHTITCLLPFCKKHFFLWLCDSRNAHQGVGKLMREASSPLLSLSFLIEIKDKIWISQQFLK